MKIKKIKEGQYEVIYNNKSIGTFDKYDLETLNIASVGSALNIQK